MSMRRASGVVTSAVVTPVDLPVFVMTAILVTAAVLSAAVVIIAATVTVRSFSRSDVKEDRTEC